MNKKTAAIALLILIALLIILIPLRDKVREQAMQAVTFEEMCFGNDTTVIYAELSSEGDVKGELDYFPQEEDMLAGSFAGTWKAGATATGLEVVHSYAAEGISDTALRTIVITDKHAQIDWDGQRGPAELSGELIPAISCSLIVGREIGPGSYSWEGDYEFGEFIPSNPGSNQSWVYNLSIKDAEGEGFIVLSVDGFQSMTRINAIGKKSGDSVDVVFDSYGPQNTSSPFKKGDVLFSLTPGSGGLLIKWNKMNPMLPANKEGSIFMKK